MSDSKLTSEEMILQGWGLNGFRTEQLLNHALNVSKFGGARTGDVIVGLGIVPQSEITKKMNVIPKGIKTLEYLRESYKEVGVRYEEILAINAKVPYLDKVSNDLSISHHIALLPKIPNDILGEMSRWDFLPLSYEGKTILAFGDISKMQLFSALGKADRIQSPIYKLIGASTERLGSSSLPTIIMNNSTMIGYRQRLSEASEGKADQQDAIQSISQHEDASDPIIASVIRILNEAISREVNDIAIVPDKEGGDASRVMFRKHQKLMDSGIYLKSGERDQVVRVLMARSRANDAGGRLLHPVDGNANFNGKAGQAFLRLSFIPLESSQGETISVSIRVLPRTSKEINMAQLNIHPELQEELKYFATRKFGLFVVCGPTGSGKSTTIASMLCAHNQLYGPTQKRISVEEPCERKLPGVLHIDVSQHRYTGDKGANDDNFASALKAILRSDPDVIFVGEVRDRESCAVSIDSANTGHLVFTTTHANDPVLGYRRLASFLPKDRHFDLVNVLEGILAQRLVTTVCQHCAEEMVVDDAVVEQFKRYSSVKGIEIDIEDLPETYKRASKSGCEQCEHSGSSGMLPVHGLLTMNPEVRRLLLSSDERDWMKAQGAGESKFTLFNSAMSLFKQGLIDLDSVML